MKYVRHSPTSQEAAAFAEGFAGHSREQVYLYILRHGGATDDEIQEDLRMSHTERPRRIELVEAGLVADSGVTRPTRSGCQAVVWVATGRPYFASVFAQSAKRLQAVKRAEKNVLSAARVYAASPVAENVGKLLAAALGLERWNK